MDQAKTGDALEVDLAVGKVKNMTTSEVLDFIPYPDFIIEILEQGGLFAQVTKQIKEGMYS